MCVLYVIFSLSQMHMNRGENVVPNRAISGSMGGVPPDFPGSNFPQREMGNLQLPPH